ncbi:MAG: class I SAM-dependent methyltransferase [Oscillochloris sp.]|nr:class I SAM-dependent methyltransferase [Oscillochloris sp.]
MSDTLGWKEDDSQAFLAYGDLFVPERERQIDCIVRLIPSLGPDHTVLELACGAGGLSEAILARRPDCRVIGLDGSAAMRAASAERLARFGDHFTTASFALEASDWRGAYANLTAVVSSLAIHHLNGPQKQTLFADLYKLLAPGGVLVIADVVEAPSPEIAALYADQWDAEVRRRAEGPGGDPAAYAFFVREGWNMYRFPDPTGMDQPSPLADQLEWLRAAGFSAVECCWALAGHAIFCGRRPLEAS